MSIDYWQPFEVGCTFHIYNRAGSNLQVFNQTEDYISFLDKWKKYFQYYLSTYAYCLVPNHFHILARVKEVDKWTVEKIQREDTVAARAFLRDQETFADFVSDQFRRFGSSVALSHKGKYNRIGALFQNKVKRASIRSDEHFIYLLCYIHHNVIHHKLGIDYMDWPFSSYMAYLSSKKTAICRDEVLSKVGGVEEFLKLHTEFQISKLNEQWEIESGHRTGIGPGSRRSRK